MTEKTPESVNYQQILDFIPLVIFFIAYYLSDLFFATLALVVATLLSIGIHYVMKWPIPRKTVIGAVFITLFGGLTLWLDDPFYIQVKSSVSFTIFAAILLIARYGFQKSLLQMLMAKLVELSEHQWLNLSRDTALFFLFVAVANEFVRRYFDTDTWVIFKVFGISIASMIFFGLAIGIRAARRPLPAKSDPSLKPKD